MKNTNKKSNLTPKSLKHFNLLSKSNILKMNLQLPFVLFFYHDFFDPLSRVQLHRTLDKYRLHSNVISPKTIKYTFDSKNSHKLKNLLSNKILAVYNKDKHMFSLDALKMLEKNKNLVLIFGIWNQKIYRHTELKKFIKEYNNIQPKFLQTCKQPQLRLFSLLFFLKSKS